MKIHGNDITFEVGMHTEVKDATFNVVRGFWPNVIAEHLWDNQGEVNTEIFFYKDNNAKKAWLEVGWSEENDLTMIGFLCEVENNKKIITIIIDDNKINMKIAEAIKLELTKFISYF